LLKFDFRRDWFHGVCSFIFDWLVAQRSIAPGAFVDVVGEIELGTQRHEPLYLFAE
jgi:hypothetical protein